MAAVEGSRGPKMRDRLILGPILIAALLALLWLDEFVNALPTPGWLSGLGYPRSTMPPGVIIFAVMAGLSVMASRELATILHD